MNKIVTKASGIHPWNPENIDFSKCLGKETQQEPSKANQMDKDNNSTIIQRVNSIDLSEYIILLIQIDQQLILHIPGFRKLLVQML